MKRILTPIILLVLIFVFNWRTQDIIFEKWFDWQNKNESVTSKTAIDAIINDFELVLFADLDSNYLVRTHSDIAPFNQLLKNKSFYRIPDNAKHLKIVNQFRIKDFMPRDKQFKNSFLYSTKPMYWLIDKQLLYKTLELQSELQKADYNANAFTIVNGHRHPKYNSKVGGASRSRHIFGEAVDISVGDINQDGIANIADKEIVLDILENKVIKDSGGIGRYPHSSRAIHYDTRGYRARWDKH